VKSLKNVKSCASGTLMSVAITQDGGVYVWGMNKK